MSEVSGKELFQLSHGGQKFSIILCYTILYFVVGYAWAEDKEHCEEYGRMLQADPAKVSARAKKRGLPQVKTKTQNKETIAL